MNKTMTVQIVSYGGGTNSCAMLVGLHERGERPDAIVFADTGGEKPHTYAHIAEMQAWCVDHRFPVIDIIRGGNCWLPQMNKDGSLETECVRLGQLPSKAYGFGTCSMKWKIKPQQKWVENFCAKRQLPISSVTRLIGFDADEYNRIERAIRLATPDSKQRFPLNEWGWGREECIAAIKRSGITQPGKSACFFCPSSKKHEILELKSKYPALFARAVEMERRALAGEGQAPATSSAGLGRRFSWVQFVKDAENKTCDLSNAGIPEMDCGCYDG